MTSTAHALVAGSIALRFPNPALAIPLSFASHYILDSIPHWDFGTNWRGRPKILTGLYAITETLFGIGLTIIFFMHSVPLLYLLSIIAVSLLPDWMEIPWYILYATRKKHKRSARSGVCKTLAYALYKIPNRFHTTAPLPLGIITQIATVAFFLTILL